MVLYIFCITPCFENLRLVVCTGEIFPVDFTLERIDPRVTVDIFCVFAVFDAVRPKKYQYPHTITSMPIVVVTQCDRKYRIIREMKNNIVSITSFE